MDKKISLSVYCITYNRYDYLKRTIEFFINSPINYVDFTVLDNASTDGTHELMEDYKKKYQNVTYIRHKYNCGGGANVCKAVELGATCDSDYIWIICDDDIFDFSNWNEVEELMDKNSDLICVCDYVFPNKSSKNDVSYQLFQSTFLPSLIIKKSILSNEIFSNMYDCVLMLFPHLSIPINVLNNRKKINVLSSPIVLPGHEYNKIKADNSFFRGITSNRTLERRKFTSWVLGFANVLTLLSDKTIISKTLAIGVLYKEIFSSWINFFDYSYNTYYISNNKNLFMEIYGLLPNEVKRKWSIYLLKKKFQNLIIILSSLAEFLLSVHFFKSNKNKYLYINICGISIRFF